MKLETDTINDGLGFEVNLNGQSYKGLVTLEALQDHFCIESNNLGEVEHFFDDKEQLLEQEICTALLRHPPFGRENIIIFPHHLR
ncbi:MAG: hypothetical protein HRU20_30045 [Pseudomonadales bacterium]|nr:hypothetical protein [Pseudomonadales bacterium]